MVVENYKKRMVLISFLLAIIVFFAGFGLGYELDTMRSSSMQTQLSEFELDLESFVIEQQFLAQTSYDVNTCSAIRDRLQGLQSETAKLGQRLEAYEAKAQLKSEYVEAKRKYTILNTNNLMMLAKLKYSCGYARPDIIIFFYKTNNDDSTRQGFILDGIYADSNDTISIFAFDGNFEKEPLITFLKDKYDVTTYPTLIVNDKVKLEGLSEKVDVERALLKSRA